MTNTGTNERLRIWKHNEQAAQMLMHKVPDPRGHVLFICDMQDTVGHDLASAIAEHDGTLDGLRDHGEKIARGGEQFQTVHCAVPHQLAKILIVHTNPRVATALNTPLAPGHMFVIVIAAGGSSLLMPPLPAADARTAAKA